MVTQIDIPKCVDSLQVSNGLLAFPNDLRGLAWLASWTAGNIVEVGCRNGATTAELCRLVPNKTFFGVDWTGAYSIVHKDQKRECPLDASEIGECCREANSAFLNCDGANVPYSEMDDVTMVFIDSDHSYSGVSTHTACALAWLDTVPPWKRPVLAWHDYAPEWMHGHPAWLKVGFYVRNQFAHTFKTYWFNQSSTAWTAFEPAFVAKIPTRTPQKNAQKCEEMSKW